MADTNITPASEAQRTPVLKKLGTEERFWSWKAGLRVIVCVLNIIAIGGVAWLAAGSNSISRASRYYDFDDFPGWQIGALIILCVSFLWCLLCVVIPFVLKPPRPLHPGIAVGIDLVLWLGFVVVGLFTLVAVFGVVTYRNNTDNIQDPVYHSNYSGYYYLAPNNTLVYNVSYVSSNQRFYNYTSGQYEYPVQNLSSVVRSCTPRFSSCAEQDQYMNDVWRTIPTRAALTVLANVVEWLDLLLHFTLFVWACVDTHRYNRGLSKAKVQVISDRIIADLEQKGLVTVRDGVVQQVNQQELVGSQQTSVQHQPEITQHPIPQVQYR